MAWKNSEDVQEAQKAEETKQSVSENEFCRRNYRLNVRRYGKENRRFHGDYGFWIESVFPLRSFFVEPFYFWATKGLPAPFFEKLIFADKRY